MNLNLIGPFVVNNPFGTEIAFAKGLKRIGCGVNTVDPNVVGHPDAMDRDADATVVFKSCVGREEELLRGLRGPVVVYQPDDARFPHIKRMMLDMRKYADLLLSFDSYGAGVALTMGYRNAETLLLTADDELYCPSPEPLERDIDVAFIGSMGDPVAHVSRRRMCEVVAEAAKDRGWVFKWGTTQDMPTILDTYRRSKVVLNHATDVGQPFGYGYGLQCRHFEVAMTRTALVSNSLYTPQEHRAPLPFGKYQDEASLIDVIRETIEGGLWEARAMHLYGQLDCGHRPEHRATQLVDFIERNR